MKNVIFAATVFLLTFCTNNDPYVPQSCFEVNTPNPKAKMAVEFQNCTDSADWYDWTFGDGNTSSEKNPTHIYNIGGEYEVQLEAHSFNHSDIASKTITIKDTCLTNMDEFDSSFGIDYESPASYLIPGNESDISDANMREIRQQLGSVSTDIAGMKKVCHWFNQNFTFENAYGGMAGVNTVDELYAIKTFYGCHSQALILSSMLRELGFPTVMIETASVKWGYDFNQGDGEMMVGHVMTEVYVNNKWILLDNNCTFVANYDCLNPFISTSTNDPLIKKGWFVFAKGVDIWEYRERLNITTDIGMVNFAENMSCYLPWFNSVDYIWQQ